MIISTDIVQTFASLGALLIDEPLARHTTFKTGGPADLMIFPHSAEAIGAIIVQAHAFSLPLTVIGGGSNLLVGDRGIRGLVLVVTAHQGWPGTMQILDDGSILADAVISKEDFVKYAARNGYGGIEFMAGIPGCLGGGIMMNAGTNLGSFADILEEVTSYQHSGKRVVTGITSNSGGYRSMGIPAHAVIACARFRLQKALDPCAVEHTIETILNDRAAKHPQQYPCAGSVFKNPSGHSAWKLINDAGLRGHRIGQAMVSELHTNFIINTGSASAREVRELILYVKKRVYEHAGVHLEPEVKMIGEFD